MKNYKQMKKDKKWSVAKEKVVTSPAVSEVKDDQGVVVRAARAEESHEDIKLIKKHYSSETGKALDDIKSVISESFCDESIKQIDAQIAELTAEKEDYVQLKADIKAL